MAVVCKICGKQYDITLFEFGRKVKCDCGNIIELKVFSQKISRVMGLKEKISEAFKNIGRHSWWDGFFLVGVAILGGIAVLFFLLLLAIFGSYVLYGYLFYRIGNGIISQMGIYEKARQQKSY